MFDNIAPTNANEPEDILAPADSGAAPAVAPLEIKSALAGQKLKPVAAQQVEEILPEEPEIEITPPILNRKGLFVIIGIILVATIGAGTYFILKSSSKKTTVQPLLNTSAAPAIVVGPPTTPPTPPAPEPIVVPAPTPEPVVTTTPPLPLPLVDTDNDGLNDDEEAKYGTDAKIADTDNDNLSDYEEIMIWKTNPLNPDTDEDTYPDGQEVKNGFNPLGAGKLLELPKK